MVKKKKRGAKKIFVLDTSVIIFDPNCFYCFQDNDVVIPIAVLEELDNMKKGTYDRNFSSRDAIRSIESIAGGKSLIDWVPIRKGLGRMKVFNDMPGFDAIAAFEAGKNDHRILNAAKRTSELASNNSQVILVTKDINMRIKARALGLLTEDYKTGMVKSSLEQKTVRDVLNVKDESVVDELFKTGSVPATLLPDNCPPNSYFIVKGGSKSVLAKYSKKNNSLVHVQKLSVCNIMPKNEEQIFAIDAILDPGIPLVILEGPSGTGKTLISVAASIAMRKNYSQIYFIKPVVHISGKDDIGFVPGSIEDKQLQYMLSFSDAINVIKQQNQLKNKNVNMYDDMFKNNKITMTILNFMRGRSFENLCVILDEAQNCNLHEIKTLLTRMGTGCKVILMGDVNQIDTLNLDKYSNGLAHVINKLREYESVAYIKMTKCERSYFAELVSKIL